MEHLCVLSNSSDYLGGYIIAENQAKKERKPTPAIQL